MGKSKEVNISKEEKDLDMCTVLNLEMLTEIKNVL